MAFFGKKNYQSYREVSPGSQERKQLRCQTFGKGHREGKHRKSDRCNGGAKCNPQRDDTLFGRRTFGEIGWYRVVFLDFRVQENRCRQSGKGVDGPSD